MKLSKSILQAMLIAVTAGTIVSCSKPKIDDPKKPFIQKPKSDSVLLNCPACGMG